MIEKTIFGAMDSSSSNNTAPIDLPIVFILAKGRSGTTLLQTMLDAHPNIIAPLESRFVVHFKNRYGAIKKWTSSVKNRFITDLQGDLNISCFWELEWEQFKNRIAQLPEDTTYGMVCKQVYVSSKSLFPKDTPKLIVDKNPIHALLIPLITSVFPTARFIYVVRDFRANCSSFYKFQPHKSMRQLGYMWIYYNTKIASFKENNPKKFHSLLYEDLVQHPEESLTKLTNFLEVAYTPAMILYYENIRNWYDAYLERSPSSKIKEMRTLGAQTVHNNLTKPLDPTLMNSWKKKLTKEQIQELETICGHYATQFGYISSAKNTPSQPVPLGVRLEAEKLLWYYSMPIWLRELKSKPNLALLPK